ncbi:MAG: hypothetical protein WCD79_04235, partial [Chthoniobacteraceae bacterium]
MIPEPDPASSKITGPRTIDRWPYFLWGCALMAFKYNLDRLIAWQGFQRSWYFWNYVKPYGVASINALPPTDAKFYYIMLLTSLPFLAVGLVLTLRRLRSAGQPLALCLLFFVPVVNLVFFAILSVLPAADAPLPSGKPGRPACFPTSAAGSALAAMLLVGSL